MTSTVRHSWWYAAAGTAAIAVVLSAACFLVWRISASPTWNADDFRRGNAASPVQSWPQSIDLGAGNWFVFRSAGLNVSAHKNGMASRFRLAGTYCMTDPGGAETRKAIVDIVETRDEKIVSGGDNIGSVEVVRVDEESVLLREFGMEETLSLSYTNIITANTQGQSTNTGSSSLSWLNLEQGEVPIATNRFGAEVSEGRWVMNRDRVMGYVQEMAENPARMSKLFDSMQPVYVYEDGKRRISGYRLQVVGEGDFYSAVGFREGDIVRKVNEMPITSYRRSMFWIDQFRQNRVNSFVMEAERDGRTVRLEYLVR